MASNLVARQLTAADIEDSSLILTLSREHRAQVARITPSASKRTFTLIEFARIVTGSYRRGDGVRSILPERGDIDGWIRIASARRGFHFVPDASEDDVVDPYRRSNDTFARSFSQVAEAVDLIADAVLVPRESR
jgi:protein-tyrosine phosphatase